MVIVSLILRGVSCQFYKNQLSQLYCLWLEGSPQRPTNPIGFPYNDKEEVKRRE